MILFRGTYYGPTGHVYRVLTYNHLRYLNSRPDVFHRAPEPAGLAEDADNASYVDAKGDLVYVTDDHDAAQALADANGVEPEEETEMEEGDLTSEEDEPESDEDDSSEDDEEGR